jgi:type II secretory pathway component PulK
MRTFIHGTDRGNATVTALVLVMVLSSVFIAFTARIGAAERLAVGYRTRIAAAIEESNREILSRYDFR